MMMRIKNNFLKILLISVVGVCVVVGYRYWHHANDVIESPLHIYDYNEFRDKLFILDLFDKNWYWLVSEYSVNFSPEFMLETGLSSQNPARAHPATLKVAYEHDKPVGFLAYYMKKPELGTLWFVVLESDARGKGYAYQMMDYAVKDLMSRGAQKIQLVTRTNNFAAQKLYRRYGFHEFHRDRGFVDYELIVQ